MRAVDVRILLVRNWSLLVPRGLIVVLFGVLLSIFALSLRNLIEVRQEA